MWLKEMIVWSIKIYGKKHSKYVYLEQHTQRHGAEAFLRNSKKANVAEAK